MPIIGLINISTGTLLFNIYINDILEEYEEIVLNIARYYNKIRYQVYCLQVTARREHFWNGVSNFYGTEKFCKENDLKIN